MMACAIRAHLPKVPPGSRPPRSQARPPAVPYSVSVARAEALRHVGAETPASGESGLALGVGLGHQEQPGSAASRCG